MDLWILLFEEFSYRLRTPVPIRCKLKILQSLGRAASSTFSFFVALRSLNLVTQLIFFLNPPLRKVERVCDQALRVISFKSSVCSGFRFITVFVYCVIQSN